MTTREEPPCTTESPTSGPEPEIVDEIPEPGPAASDDEADRATVESERTAIRKFVSGLSMDEIKSGDWFVKLLAHAMSSYTTKVDWAYFQEKYKGVPADAIVDQRIKMAVRYAAIEGGISASAYTGAVAATIGSLGGASPIAVPAAVATLMVDIAYVTQLQLRLSYDVAVLYRVPLDLSDPDDLWKFIRVAFTIKGGEAVREGAVKVVPLLMRPLIKHFYSKGVLTAARGLPVVGRFLLQRTVIKVGIPVVGIPLAVIVNRYSTQITGQHARAVFRNEARVLEAATSLISHTAHPQTLLWVAWLVIDADGKISDDEALLMRHLTRLAHQRHGTVDEDLATVVDVDPESVWRRIGAESGDLSHIVTAGTTVAEIDGPINPGERQILAELTRRCEASEEAQAAT